MKGLAYAVLVIVIRGGGKYLTDYAVLLEKAGVYCLIPEREIVILFFKVLLDK